MSYKHPCGAPDGAHPKPCDGCERILADVVSRLATAEDRELGEMLAAFRCKVYGVHSPFGASMFVDSCEKRGLPDKKCCKPCLVRREVERRITAKKAARAEK